MRYLNIRVYDYKSLRAAAGTFFDYLYNVHGFRADFSGFRFSSLSVFDVSFWLPGLASRSANLYNIISHRYILYAYRVIYIYTYIHARGA